MLVKVNAVADKTHEDKYEVKAPAIAVSQGTPFPTQQSSRGLSNLQGKSLSMRTTLRASTLSRKSFWGRYSNSIEIASVGKANAKYGNRMGVVRRLMKAEGKAKSRLA